MIIGLSDLIEIDRILCTAMMRSAVSWRRQVTVVQEVTMHRVMIEIAPNGISRARALPHTLLHIYS